MCLVLNVWATHLFKTLSIHLKPIFTLDWTAWPFITGQVEIIESKYIRLLKCKYDYLCAIHIFEQTKEKIYWPNRFDFNFEMNIFRSIMLDRWSSRKSKKKSNLFISSELFYKWHSRKVNKCRASSDINKNIPSVLPCLINIDHG